jgi:predicted alpha-1,2-mannosidase
MRTILIFVLLTVVVAAAQTGASPSAYDSVDTFIGTAADGNTFPGATLPFGMMQWSPDTRPDGWYHYGDKSIRGFSLTHISGAGCPVYADVPILPWPIYGGGSGPMVSNSFDDTSLFFSHAHETAQPGYYSVEANTASETGVKTELTVTEHAGIGRFYFPTGAGRLLLFKAAASANITEKNRETDGGAVEIRGQDTVVGSVHSGGFCNSPTHYVLYFAAKFEKPFTASGTWTDKITAGATSASGHRAGAYVSFPSGAEPVVMKIGISFVSIENAEANLVAEIPGWDFDAVHASAKAEWAKMLERVQADGGTPEQRTIFYTGLYHMLLSPNLFSDMNGDYIGFDEKIRRSPPDQQQFANFSDWDIYRDIVQFQALLLPQQTSQMMQSLVRDAEQSGWLPRWAVANDVSYIMGGDSPAILLSEGYAFGARNFDLKSALHFMIKGATEPGKGPHNYAERPGLQEYLTRGYVPLSDDPEAAASITLEYASADFAVSRFASAMGDHAHAASLLRSSQNWRKLFDEDGGWIRPRTGDGKFLEGWDPDHLLPHHKNWDKDNQMGFEEGSTWQYSFMIPHNYAGVFQAMGGNANAVARLDKFFEKLSGWALPNFTVANEPDFCAPYAYLWTGNPWKTQQIIDRIRRETFTTKPDGLPGNDDLGATSGVYVWNAIGMYPVIPGVGGVALGTPMFSRVLMQLGNGSTLEVLSHGQGIYVHSVKVNGKPHESSWLPLSALSQKHNRMEFELTNEPDHAWAVKPASFPPSFDVPGK